MARKIRKNDEVVVIAGRDKGKRGRVLRIVTKKDRVVVEGINVVTRHLRRNPQNPQAGGRVERPAPIAISNVALWSADEHRGVRVAFQGEGRAKQRVSAKTKKPLSAAGRRKEKGEAKKEG